MTDDIEKLVGAVFVLGVFIYAFIQTGIWIPNVPVEVAKQVHEAVNCNELLTENLNEEDKKFIEQNCINGRIAIDVLDNLDGVKIKKDLKKHNDSEGE